MSLVRYSAVDGVGLLVLDRADRLNAISRTLVHDLNAALDRALEDKGADVIVLAAEGRAFCAGDDLVEYATELPEEAEGRATVEALQGVTRRLMLGGKPVVCAAQGWMIGGGAAWPLNADFLVLSSDARMRCPEATFGLFPTGAMSALLPDRIGQARANQVLWLAETLDAARLFELGLANAVVPNADLRAAALTLAKRIRTLPATSRTRYKRAHGAAWRDRIEQALAYEAQCCVDALTDPTVRPRIAQWVAADRERAAG